ncbi:MAG: hypothetical protein VCF07_01635 [Nitrospinota bacterium]
MPREYQRMMSIKNTRQRTESGAKETQPQNPFGFNWIRRGRILSQFQNPRDFVRHLPRRSRLMLWDRVIG